MELEEVATAWIEMWQLDLNSPQREAYDWVSDFEFECVDKNPDQALDLILEILKRDLDKETMGLLAAGPLEDVLANHGEGIIERVEILARKSPKFSNLLGGVWQNAMSEEVWERVQSCWNRSGCDRNS